jgi:transposase InsO family protein
MCYFRAALGLRQANRDALDRTACAMLYRGTRRACAHSASGCDDYVAVLQQHGIQISMSRVGNPYDNAEAESFMKALKQEEVDGRAYRDLDHLRRSIAEFAEDVHNRQRLHSALGYQSPVEFEEALSSGGISTGLCGGRVLLPPSPTYV